MQHSCGQIYDKSTYSEELAIRVVRVVMASIFLISLKKNKKKKHDKVIMFT